MKKFLIVFFLLGSSNSFAGQVSTQDVAQANLGYQSGHFRNSGKLCAIDITVNPNLEDHSHLDWFIEFIVSFSRPGWYTTMEMPGEKYNSSIPNCFTIQANAVSCAYAPDNWTVHFGYDSNSLKIAQISYENENDICDLNL